MTKLKWKWNRKSSGWVISEWVAEKARIIKWIERDHGSTVTKYMPSYGDEQGEAYLTLKKAKAWCESRAQLEECRARWRNGDYSVEEKVLGIKKKKERERNGGKDIPCRD